MWENTNYVSIKRNPKNIKLLNMDSKDIYSETTPVEFWRKNECNIEGLKMLTPLNHSQDTTGELA